MKDLNELIKEIKEILSISHEQVIFRREFVRYEAELDWNVSLGCWVICYQNIPSKFSIIHELGHIYFAKKIVRCEDFAIPKYRNSSIIRDIL